MEEEQKPTEDRQHDHPIGVHGKPHHGSEHHDTHPHHKHEEHDTAPHETQTHHEHESIHPHTHQTKVSPLLIILVIAAAALVVFNQFQLSQVAKQLHVPSSIGKFIQNTPLLTSNSDLRNVQLEPAQSTANTLRQVFDLKDKNGDEVMSLMFPTGTPEYGAALGVSFDDPVNSLAVLSRMLPQIKSQVQTDNPEAFQRYINLASQPYGVSCEYCCGVGPAGANKKGDSLCGCQHNPALLALTLYLTANTDYSDAQILHEVMLWKTLFFPKNMIELGTKVAGGDSAVLTKLPGMVGGC